MQDTFYNSNPQQDSSSSLSSLVDNLKQLLSTDLSSQHPTAHLANVDQLNQLLQDIQNLTGNNPQNLDISGSVAAIDHLLQNLTHSLDFSGQSYPSGVNDLHQMIDPSYNLSDPSVNNNDLGISFPSLNSDLSSVSNELQSRNSLDFNSTGNNNNLSVSSVELQPKASFNLNLGANSPNSQSISGYSVGESLVNPTIIQLHPTPQVMQSCNGVITPDSDNSVTIYDSGDIYWHSGGYTCHLDGHEFTNSAGHFGRLASNLKVFDKNDHYVGYVTPNGCAYTTDGQLFARGRTAIWAAAVLLCNTR